MLKVTNTEFTGVELRKVKEMIPTQVDAQVRVVNLRQLSSTSVLLEFAYMVNYQPNLATFTIYGQSICVDTKDNIDQVLAQYGKNETVGTALTGEALNIIYANCAISGIFIIRPFGLIPPFVPPGPIVASIPPKISKAPLKTSKKK